mgnify:CR=1 FL=1
MFDVDDLKIYRGSDIRITDKIIVTQPTIDQIIEFGEKKYFQNDGVHFNRQGHEFAAEEFLNFSVKHIK